MHEAICDQCGKPCEVPFRPAPGKPVYCTACFGAKRDGGDDRGESRFPQRSFGDRAIQARTDFGGGTAGGNNDEVKRQLELLNAKMDRLIKAVEAMSAPAPFVKPVMVEEKVRETLRAAMNQNPVVTKPVDAKSAATIKPVAAAKPAKAKKTVKKGKK
jgi:CxxC-x17-CxxC domain-containing protein